MSTIRRTAGLSISKSWRLTEAPYLVQWDVSGPLNFVQGMATLLRLDTDSGFVPPPVVTASLVSIRKGLGQGRTSRAFLADYAGKEVVAKLYDDAPIVQEDANKLTDARVALEKASSHSDDGLCQIPALQASEDRWLLITPMAIPFTPDTIRKSHISKLVSTLRVIHSPE